MDNLEPITRNEMFLNGDDLEPITREEMILAGADLEPITRHEWFLKKYRGGGDVTIERLAVTENGTYSESGKAYSPVVVNVPTPPIPENAYLLNNLSGLPADIASFSDGTDLPMASLKVTVTPYQDLSHGDPSPENICPISGWDEVNVTKYGDNILDESNLTSGYIDTDGTITNNVIYSTTDYLDFSNVNSIKYGVTKEDTGGWYYRIGCYNASKTFLGFAVNRTLSSGVYEGDADLLNNTNYIRVCWVNSSSNRYIYDKATYNTYTIDLDGTRYGGTLDATNGTMIDTLDYIASYNGETLPSTWISDRDVYAEGTTPTIGAEVVYTRATPITVQLAPTQVKSLEGENNIFANCGNIIELKYFSKEV